VGAVLFKRDRTPYLISTQRSADLYAVSLMFVFVLAAVCLSLMPVVTNQLRTEIHLNDAQIGLLTSVFMGFYGAAGITSGFLAPRWGGRLLGASIGCFLTGSLVFALSSGLAGFLSGRALQGLGGGMVVATSNTVLAHSLPAKWLGRAWGIVGIGFGLQKIFSNLVSGVILLLDKSIKPGDIIELGGNVGTIQTLSARYALLRTLSGKDILVPNEDLISGQVINWTRTDRRLWFSVPVGVAYDADVPLAMRLLEEAAASVSRVLKDPPPKAHLTDFGDNSVNLTVGFWIADPENGLLGLTTEVNLAIWERFLAHRIEIPFPQRDIHVRNLPEITIRNGGKP
jgi:MFS family permease